jgi:PDZ domain-containing protein
MTRTARTLLVAGVISAGLLLVVLLAPVPYVVLTPTVPTNTLGNDPRTPGQPVCAVQGRTYPTSGQLDLTTVGVASTRPTLAVALARWAQAHDAVVPKAVIYPPGQSQKETDQKNEEAMADSRDSAVTAALAELKLPDATVGTVAAHSAAAGRLEVGDVFTAVDGLPTPTFDAVAAAIQAHQPGDPVTLTIRRDSEPLQVQVVLGSATQAGKKVARLGVGRVDASFNLAGVSGPSAGLMFALCVIDKLTPTNLAAGRIIAGTGEIDAKGNVSAIGGVQQKIFGAAAAGAQFFLVPADNCAEAAKAHEQSVRLVRIPASTPTETSLHAAYTDLLELHAGRTDLPRC